MKSLSLTQPWATLVAIGAKRIETRSWRTDYRGPLAIHAAKGFPWGAQELCLTEPFNSVLTAAGFPSAESQVPRGAIVAICRLVDCLPICAPGKLPKGRPCVAVDDDGLVRVWRPGQIERWHFHEAATTLPHEHAFGDYTPGRWAWLLDDVKPLPEPIPARGALGLWEWTP